MIRFIIFASTLARDTCLLIVSFIHSGTYNAWNAPILKSYFTYIIYFPITKYNSVKYNSRAFICGEHWLKFDVRITCACVSFHTQLTLIAVVNMLHNCIRHDTVPENDASLRARVLFLFKLFELNLKFLIYLFLCIRS